MAKINKKLFKEALEGSLGTQRDLSRRLKVSDAAISKYLDKHPDMRELFEKKRLSNVDKAEHEIFDQLDFNDDENLTSSANIRQKASQFILTRLGKSKGWVEKTEQEVEHKGEGLKVIIERVVPNGDKTST